jgi:hypothetical protein
LGEWGELLDDYMKYLYKPGYVFEPEDELGDIWYYVRILAYQKSYTPDGEVYNPEIDTDYLIAMVMGELVVAFRGYKNFHRSYLDFPYSALILIAERYSITLDDLTRSNWEKLKPGSERGDEWQKARVSTDYARGKIAIA